MEKMTLEQIRERYPYMLDMEVRDYELDCEQIVNNANYLHYIEHTRHKFCIHAGMPFIELHRRGIDAVVRKINIEYISSLRSGDKFISCLNVRKQGAQFIFDQCIFTADGIPVIAAEVTAVVLKDGKVTRGEEIARYFEKYL